MGQVRIVTGRSAPLLALPSRISSEEPSPHAGGNARARQGHRRRRGSSLRIHRQCARPPRREYLLPQMPQDCRGTHRLHRQHGAHPKRQMPILPASHPRRVAGVNAGPPRVIPSASCVIPSASCVIPSASCVIPSAARNLALFLLPTTSDHRKGPCRSKLDWTGRHAYRFRERVRLNSEIPVNIRWKCGRCPHCTYSCSRFCVAATLRRHVVAM